MPPAPGTPTYWNDPTSQWIAPSDGLSSGHGIFPQGVYDYRTTFDLTGYDPSKAYLTGIWQGYPAANDILFNGQAQHIPTPFLNPSPFTLSSGFVSGLNTLDFLVNNTGFGNNPTDNTWVQVGDMQLAAAWADGPSYNAVEGVPYNGVVATLHGLAPGHTYSADIAWGDGTQSTSYSNITGDSNHDAALNGGHTYAEEGSYSITVTIHDSGNSVVQTSNFTEQVADQPLQNPTSPPAPGSFTAPSRLFSLQAGSPLSLTLGQDPGLQTLATFTYPDTTTPASAFTATVAWGDGKTATATVSGSAGSFTVQADPAYADAGLFTALVNVQVQIQGTKLPVDPVSLPVTVTTPPPSYPLQATPSRISATEGEALDPATLLATFTDNNPAHLGSCHSATVNWGDGPAVEAASVVVSGSNLQVEGGHTYASAGVYAVEVTLSDETGHHLSAYETALVAFQAPAVSGRAATLAVASGIAFGPLAVGTVVNADTVEGAAGLKAWIDWADGSALQPTTVLGAAAPYWVAGSHTYSTVGAYTARLYVADQDGGVSTATFTVQVQDVAVGVQASVPMGTFQDADPQGTANDYTVTPVSGAPSSGFSYSVTPSSGTAVFAVTIRDTWNQAGTSQVQVQVTDHASNLMLSRALGVAPAVLTALSAAAVSATVGTALSNQVVARFQSSDPSVAASAFSATIDWGDGGRTSGTIVADPGGSGFDVEGSYTYARPGTDPITVQVTGAGGEVLLTNQAQVGPSVILTWAQPDESAQLTWDGGMPQTAILLSDSATSYLTSQSRSLTSGLHQLQLDLSDLDVTAGSGPLSAVVVTVDWGDGTPPVQITPTGDGAQALHVMASHVYDSAATRTVVIRLADPQNQAPILAHTIVLHTAAFVGLAGVDTGPTVLAQLTSSGPLVDPQVTISWGDGQQSAADLTSTGAENYDIRGTHEYAAPGDYPLTIILSDALGAHGSTTGFAYVLDGPAQTVRGNDPDRAEPVTLGEASIDLNLGAVRLQHPLDFDQNPGTAVGGDPALVYNSATASPIPILQVEIPMSPDLPLPESATLQLQRDDGSTTGPPVTFPISGFAPGDTLVFAVPGPTEATGQDDDLQVTGTLTYANGLSLPWTGPASVPTVNRTSRPFGAGWGLNILDQLYPVCGGILWVTGSGDYRFFADKTSTTYGDGPYQSPAEDYGTLSQNDDFSFTYLAKDQTRWRFNAQGQLVSIAPTSGPGRQYNYDGQGHLTQVMAPDGAIASLTYGGPAGTLSTIGETGNRTLTLTYTIDPSTGQPDLAGITDVDQTTRAFSYTGGKLSRDQWDPYDTNFTYGVDGMLSTVDRGLNNVYKVSAAGENGLGQTIQAPSGSASLRDGLDRTTTYTLDERGRQLALTDPDGNTQSWRRNPTGDVAIYTDARGYQTAFWFNGPGDLWLAYSAPGSIYVNPNAGPNDLVTIKRPDGGATYDRYDPTFHKVTTETTIDSPTQATTALFTYDPSTADLVTRVDAAGTNRAATTGYQWSAGLLTLQTNPDGSYQTYHYDAARRLTGQFLYDNTGSELWEETYSDDGNGNPAEVSDGANNNTVETFSNSNRLTLKTVETAITPEQKTTYEYEPAGQLTLTADLRLDQSGLYLDATTDGYNVLGSLVSEQVENGDLSVVRSEEDDYNAGGDQTATTDGANDQHRYTYDGEGRVLTELVYSPPVPPALGALVRATTNAYDGAGNLTLQTQGDGSFTTSTFDPENRLGTALTFNAQGVLANAVTNRYDFAGNLTQTLDGDGNYTSYGYDVEGNLTSEQRFDSHNNPVGGGETDQYDLRNRVTKKIDGDNNYTTLVYDGANRVTLQQVYDADSTLVSQTSNVYDHASHVTQRTDGNGNYRVFTYDGADQVLTEQDYAAPVGGAGSGTPLRTSSEQYDGAGNLTKTIDGDSNYVLSIFNGAGQLTLQQDYTAPVAPATVGTLVRQLSEQYNLAGAMTARTDGAGNETLYQYDGAGAETGQAVADYDRQTGQPDILVSQGGEQLDLAGNVTRQNHGDGSYQLFTRDGAGRVLIQQDFNADNTLTRSLTNSYDGAGQLTQVVDGDGNVTLYTYDAAGRVLTTLVYTGNGLPPAQAVLQTPVSAVTNAYDGAGYLTRKTDGDSNYTQYLYDGAGNLLSQKVYKADGTLVQATTDKNDLDGNPTLVLDGDNNQTSMTYDDQSRVLSQLVYTAGTSPRLVSQLTKQYDPAGNLTRQIDGDSKYVQYRYDGDGQVTSTQAFDSQNNPVGGSTSDTYDLAGEPVASTNADGEFTTKTFDGLGHLLTEGIWSSVSGSLVEASSDGYDLAGNLTRRTDGDGNFTQLTYNGDGQELTEQVYTAPAQAGGNPTLVRTASRAYDQAGNHTRNTDGAGNFQLFTFDGAGERLSEQDYTAPASGSGPPVLTSASSQAYDEAGNVTRRTDGNGNYMQYTYDAAGNLLTAQRFDRLGNPVEGTSSDQYDPAGRLTYQADGAGNFTQMTYDGAGQETLVQVYSAGGALASSQSKGYDLAGNVTQLVDGAGDMTVENYDGANRLTLEQVYTGAPAAGMLASSVTNGYDAASKLTQVTNGAGDVTKYAYDAADHRTLQIVGYGSAAAQPTTDGFDLAGNLTQVQDGDGNSTRFSYDGAGQKTLMVDAKQARTSWQYDQAGNLTQTLDRDNRKSTYAYDGDGHVTQQTWYTASGTVADTFAFQYDLAGELVSAANSAGAYTLAYNAAQQPTLVHEPFGLALTMGYNGAGQRTLVSDSLGGSVQSSYDGDNNLTARVLTQSGGPTLRVDQGYDPAGRVTHQARWSDGAGTAAVGSTDEAYNGAGDVTSLRHTNAAGAPLALYTLLYDGAGQLTQSTDHGTATNYTYDQAGELTSDGTHTYVDDAAGNRKYTSSQPAQLPENEVTNDGTWTYSYDGEGNLSKKVNLTTGDTWQYGYNNANQLTAVQEWSADPSSHSNATLETQASYKYDPFGNRLEQDYFRIPLAGMQVQRYAYDGWDPATPAGSGTENWSVWADLNATSSLTTRYLRGDVVDQLFARVDLVTTLGGSTLQPSWYLTDQQGSIRDVANASGAVVDTVKYDGFGNILSQTNTSQLGRYAWTGRELDAETGLQYNRARYYDSTTGRWITQDPLSFDAGDSNLYRYARNAPTGATDPSGMDPPAERGADSKSSEIQGVLLVVDQAKLKEAIEAKTSKAREVTRTIATKMQAIDREEAALEKYWNTNYANKKWERQYYFLNNSQVFLTPQEQEFSRTLGNLNRDLYQAQDQLATLLTGKSLLELTTAQEAQARANQQLAQKQQEAYRQTEPLMAGPTGAQQDQWERQRQRGRQITSAYVRLAALQGNLGGTQGYEKEIGQIYDDLNRLEWEQFKDGSATRILIGMVPIVGSLMEAGIAISEGETGGAIFFAIMAGLDVAGAVQGVKFAGRIASAARGVEGGAARALSAGQMNVGGVSTGAGGSYAVTAIDSSGRPVTLWHGTTSNRASRILGSADNAAAASSFAYEAEGFRGVTVYFAEDSDAARYFAYERLALTRPGETPPSSLTVIKFSIPEELASRFGLLERYPITGELGALRPVDIGTGYESRLFSAFVVDFNEALQTRRIVVERFRIGTR